MKYTTRMGRVSNEATEQTSGEKQYASMDGKSITTTDLSAKINLK